MAAVLGIVVGRWFLKREVCSQLTALNQAPVAVDQIQLGFCRHEVIGVRLLQSDRDDTAWTEIERLSLELPVWKIVFGTLRPDSIVASGVVTRIELDAQGNLATRIPDWQGDSQLPSDAIEVRQARLEVHRPDCPPIVADGIRITIGCVGQQVSVAGSVGEALGGTWAFNVDTDLSPLETSGRLSCDRFCVATEELVRQALLPASASELVRAEAESSVELKFAYQSGIGLRYELVATPEALVVQLEQQDLGMTGGGGVLRFANGVVSIDQLSGNTMGGQVSVSGQADLRRRPWRGHFTAKISDLSIPDVLRDRPVLAAVTGQCSGKVEIDAVLDPDDIQVTAEGSGTIRDAGFIGVRAQPVEWQLSLRTPPDSEGPPLAGQIQLDVAVDDADIADALHRFDIETGETKGSLSLAGTVRIPLETIADPASYAAEGSVQMSEAVLAGIRVRAAQTSFSYSQGKLSLQNASSQIGPDGQVSGTVDIQLAPAGNFAGQFDFTTIHAAVISRTLLRTDAPIDGTSSGHLTATVAIDRMNDIEAWHLEGEARSDRLETTQLRLDDLASGFKLDAGCLSLSEGRAKWHEAAVTYDGSLVLKTPFELRGRIDLADIDVQGIMKRRNVDLPIDISGLGHLTGQMRATLTPFSWTADGTGRLPDFAIDSRSLKNATFHWKADAAGLDVKEMRASLLDGEVDLAARLPLAIDGNARVSGSFRDLDAALVQDLSPIPELVLGGRISGELELTAIATPDKRAGAIRFRGAQVTTHGATIEGLSGSVSFQADQAKLQLTGSVLEGTVGFRGDLLPASPERMGSTLDGRLEVRDAQLSRLWPLLKLQHRFGSLRAVAEGEFDVRLTDISSLPEVDGHLFLRKPSWAGREVTPLAEADIQLRDRWLRLTNMTCRIANGTATGELAVQIGTQANGTFTADLDRISITDLMGAAGLSARQLQGNLDATIRGRVGTDWNGNGQLRLTNGKFAGVPVNSVRMPIDWALAPSSGNARARVRLTSAQVAGGRVTGDADVSWNGRLGITGKAKLESLQVKPLARAIPMIDDSLAGRLSGEFTVKGTNVRSIDELSGSYSATLSQSQALMLPVLDRLTSWLGIGSPSSTTFSGTSASGHFGNGVIHVKRMTMESSSVRMFITGKMNTRGGIDLSVTADVPSAAAAGIVVGLLRPVDFLRRRLLFFYIDGSIRSPIVQPRTAEFIQQEIIMFFWPFAVTP